MKKQKNIIKNFEEGWVNLRGPLDFIGWDTNNHFFIYLDEKKDFHIKVPKKFVLIYEDSMTAVVAINLLWETYKVYFIGDTETIIGPMSGKTLYDSFLKKNWTPKSNQRYKLK